MIETQYIEINGIRFDEDLIEEVTDENPLNFSL